MRRSGPVRLPFFSSSESDASPPQHHQLQHQQQHPLQQHKHQRQSWATQAASVSPPSHPPPPPPARRCNSCHVPGCVHIGASTGGVVVGVTPVCPGGSQVQPMQQMRQMQQPIQPMQQLQQQTPQQQTSRQLSSSPLANVGNFQAGGISRSGSVSGDPQNMRRNTFYGAEDAVPSAANFRRGTLSTAAPSGQLQATRDVWQQDI